MLINDQLKSKKMVFWTAVIFSLFQIVAVSFNPWSSQITRILHVALSLVLVYLFTGNRSDKNGSLSISSLLMIAMALGSAMYQWVFEIDIMMRSGTPTWLDLSVATITAIMVFDATRRLVGWALPVISAVFLIYALFGQYFPGLLEHRGYDFDQVIATIGLGTEGIFGMPIYVSSTYIFLFILFGTFMEKAGMIQMFTDVAIGLVGHRSGGPAKVAVLSSAMMGTINGSGVANVVSTGQLTIPMMKRFGYRPAFAGAVEASASMGGQIMPPIMGAVAFIMAENINMVYSQIALAALLPALFYFASIFWMVHLEAGKRGLDGIPRNRCPNAGQALLENWYFLIPLLTMISMMMAGFSPMFAAGIGLSFIVILMLGLAIATGSGVMIRTTFWIVLALACSAFFSVGVWVIFAVVVILLICTYFKKNGSEVRSMILESLAQGAVNALFVAVTCAMVGVLIGITNLTGLASTLGATIVEIGSQNLGLALVLIAATCLIMGIGIPSIPNYIILSAIAAPILLDLGIPLIASHLFIFYFGMMAELTPPVCLAAFAAAPIARESGFRIGIQAVLLASAGFVVPFLFVTDTSLLLPSENLNATFWASIKVLVAIAALGASIIGYLTIPLGWLHRALLATVSVCLVVSDLNEIGVFLMLLSTLIFWYKLKIVTDDRK